MRAANGTIPMSLPKAKKEVLESDLAVRLCKDSIIGTSGGKLCRERSQTCRALWDAPLLAMGTWIVLRCLLFSRPCQVTHRFGHITLSDPGGNDRIGLGRRQWRNPR